MNEIAGFPSDIRPACPRLFHYDAVGIGPSHSLLYAGNGWIYIHGNPGRRKELGDDKFAEVVGLDMKRPGL